MPAQIQSQPHLEPSAARPGHHHGTFDYEMASKNGNMQHKEALRLALGTILTPKRPYTPSSHSSSGTASPVPHFHFSTSPSYGTPPPAPPPPHPTPIHPYHSHEHHWYNDHHAHTPSRLSLSRTNSTGSQTSGGESASASESANEPAVHVPAPIPVQANGAVDAGHSHAVVDTPGSRPGSGAGTPKAHFIETLQSKSAWDALIHGSFS